MFGDMLAPFSSFGGFLDAGCRGLVLGSCFPRVFGGFGGPEVERMRGSAWF